MSLQRLVEIHGRKRFHIETREPHCTDEHDAERVVGILEIFLQVAFQHLFAMRRDVQSPFAESVYLVLLLAHDDGHLGRFHPVYLARQFQLLLLPKAFELSLLCRNGFPPILLNVVEHHHTGDLVHADEHGFPRFPDARIMVHEITGDGAEALLGHDDMDAATQLLLDLLSLVLVEVLFLHCIKQFVVDLGVLDVELVRPVLVEQGNGRAVFYRAVEVVDGNIAAEGALRQVVVIKNGRSGEAEPGSRGQKSHHILGEYSVVRAMRLVREHDDVVIGVNRARFRLVEFLD